MFRKILLSIMTIVVVFTLLPQVEAQAAGFSDVKNYKEEINFLSGKGIITGYEDGSFKPASNVTRLQAVTMILREKGITDFTAADPGFTDLKIGNHGYDKVAKAVELGIISGKTNKNGTKYFDASAPLTRGQMAKILVEGYNLQKTVSVRFKDVPESSGFKRYISILATENITTGYLDDTFRPNNKLTREHFAVFMARLLNDDFKIEKIPNPQPKPEPTPEPTPEEPYNDNVSVTEQAVLDFTNAERVKAGLKPLQFDAALQNSAKQKSADMATNNYFSHTSPTYGSPFDQMRAHGVTYRSAGENIAKGYRNAEAVVTAWMNSPGHRRNILNDSFTHIGIGYDGNGHYWTQQFIGK
ncbi:hypothetical protein CSV79_12190 [Sporosarcina sp. P13]|uniref:S-layer homology domain-containing protein n=1 Tax=Sporosarcina sp. P13 TaxID=2048263 RepID=UPI000C166EC0|nr:hypothetical protein CSV79_12190 [Sporosarcina sp. P13]